MDPFDDNDGYYSDDDDLQCYGSDGGVTPPDSDDEIDSFRSSECFSVLKEDDIRRRQSEDIAEVSAVLNISTNEAIILLCNYKWSVGRVHEAWFSDEDAVRRSVGLLTNAVIGISDRDDVTCGICFDSYSHRQIVSAVCGHPYCRGCWKEYVSTAISDGRGCLTLRCPHPSCSAAVSREIVDKFATEADKKRYSSYLLNSYVEESTNIKWCPAAGCEYAVEYPNSGSTYEVSCLCSHKFCWNCSEDPHRPADCETVKKWNLKNTSESENVNWILAFTKPCPRCKRNIEKNQGCNHMICGPPCRYEFCWLCLGSWHKHIHNYTCNLFSKEAVTEKEKERELAAKNIKRYIHHYERWINNESSRQKAASGLDALKLDRLEELSVATGVPVPDLDFIVDAWKEIVECRRLLKWTYAYGYFLPEEENAKRELFGYLQGQAESALERLHRCVEKELEYFFEAEETSSEVFKDYRMKLLGLTRATKNFFENLVVATENGLSEVVTQQDLNAGFNTLGIGC